MYIVIGGGGIAGTVLARALIDMKHDVVVIDPDREVCESLYADSGAVTVNGSATDIKTLKEAGMEKADVAIACMYKDADNMSFCLLARSLGVPRIITKMRDPDYEAAFRAAGVDFICDMIAILKKEVLADLQKLPETLEL